MRSVLVIIVSLVAVGCGSAAPCRQCPPVDGTYAVQWQDGGNAACLGPRVPAWTLTDDGQGQVTTKVGENTLGGTLYDTYDLFLTGSETGKTYRFRALVIPTGTSLDGGVRLEGTFTTRTVPTMGQPCESTEPFTAQRTSR